jgi:hypothetical protein
LSDVAPEADRAEVEAQIAADEAELAEPDGLSVRVRLRGGLYDTFESGVEGVDLITPSGVLVTPGQLKAVMDAAATSRVVLLVEES